MDATGPAQRSHVNIRQPDPFASTLGQFRHHPRMALRKRHAHVDHVCDGQKRLVASRLVQRHRRIGLERQDRLAVDRRADAFHQRRRVGRDEPGQIRFIGTVSPAGDGFGHPVDTDGFAERYGILRQRNQAHGRQDILAAHPTRQPLAIPAFVDLPKIAPDILG